MGINDLIGIGNLPGFFDFRCKGREEFVAKFGDYLFPVIIEIEFVEAFVARSRF